MIKKFTKIRNIILLFSILSSTLFATYTTNTTIITEDTIHLSFNINNLEAIGNIQVDEELKNELLNSFYGISVQSGENIFRNFFNIVFMLGMDKALNYEANETNFFKENHLLPGILNELPMFASLLEQFRTFLMQEMKGKDLVTFDQFLNENVANALEGPEGHTVAEMLSNMKFLIHQNCPQYSEIELD